ncbi:MAG: hypothetical protein RSF81_07160, partial [Oscillospiraceae bacterium]
DRRLDAMDKRFDGIDSRLDSMDKRFDGIDSRLDALEQGQKDMKAFILENNNAIALIFTDALEYTNKKIDAIEYITKSNLYDIALMKKAM